MTVKVWKPESNKCQSLHQAINVKVFTTSLHHIFQRVICPLTEEEEFAKYSGMEGLLEFYREECGLVVYNRAIPDFKIPTSGDLVNNILDLTYHLSKVDKITQWI